MSRDYLSINRDYWNAEAPNWAKGGAWFWSHETPHWGNWNFSEEELRLLPPEMAGMDAIELGCGTAYVAGWMARRGARVTAIDLSEKQLATARQLDAEYGTKITFLEGNAEAVPCPDASFDFAISEYGAAIWCDPERWLPEAWRLLRPGGRLVFLGNHPLTLVCTPPSGADVEPRLHRTYRDMRQVDFTDVEIEPAGIEFNRPIADWMALFSEIGFRIEDYHELYAPEGFEETRGTVPADWANRFPAEHVWKLRKP